MICKAKVKRSSFHVSSCPYPLELMGILLLHPYTSGDIIHSESKDSEVNRDGAVCLLQTHLLVIILKLLMTSYIHTCNLHYSNTKSQ